MDFTGPISFQPLFFERIWGGRLLQTLYGKPLPPEMPVGESWEIVDREDAQSRVADGPARGLTLHALWTEHREAVFGMRHADKPGRFPLLLKLLDAREKLSVQVHPPADVAADLGGEPKTEMWVVAHAGPDADLFAGLKSGVTRDAFESALYAGTVENLIHRIPTRVGAAMVIPSGRIHAIGAGNLIVEVQQNSDTTYRVFDWNRVGLDGKPRELHIAESMRSIDFDDFEPGLESGDSECLVDDPLFRVERWQFSGTRQPALAGEFAVFAVLSGVVSCGATQFGPGDFFLVPAAADERELQAVGGRAEVLRTTLP